MKRWLRRIASEIIDILVMYAITLIVGGIVAAIVLTITKILL